MTNEERAELDEALANQARYKAALESIIALYNDDPDDLETMDAGIKIAMDAIARKTR